MDDFYTLPSPIDRSSRNKLIRENLESNDTINEMKRTDIYRTSHPNSNKVHILLTTLYNLILTFEQKAQINKYCLPFRNSLYVLILSEHICVQNTCWCFLCSEDLLLLDRLLGRFCHFPFYSLPVPLSFLVTTPFPSRITKNIRGHMVVPCSRVLAFHLPVSNQNIRRKAPSSGIGI